MSARGRPVAEPLTHAPPLTAVHLFPSADQSAGRAREALRPQLQDWGLAGELADSAELLLSELVTNAVKAEAPPGAEVTVRFELSAGRLRLEVQDASDELPVMTHPEEDAECGRGLVLLDALASGWGVTPDGIGKAVWAELAVSDASALRLLSSVHRP
ncbi:ATP-binding protein [Streptomyces inhibens]|uniref:ATP-binding protein n=1 Tax=Streptomyces inhibens TaxID=2293571 RepID=A0A371PQF6_STRIH|nr:ATP-binding protein [Streptomyces inhibens]REK84579.1 ATP-binding protein [Streptomyces inhibens]